MQVAQASRGRGKRKRSDKGGKEDSGGQRADERTQAILRMSAEGAYRKATMAVLEQDDVLTGSECRTWAHALHPRAGDETTALVKKDDRARSKQS